MAQKKKKRISVASAKDKGRRLQKYVAQKISEFTGLSWGKDEPIAPREMGQSGVDIRLVGEEARKRFPFAVECKYQETWQIPAWIKQAEANVEDSLPHWLLFIRKNRSPEYVVMKADLFFSMLCAAFPDGYVKFKED